MVNPYYELFQYTREDIYTLQINPEKKVLKPLSRYLNFLSGAFILFHGHYIDGGFTLPFYVTFSLLTPTTKIQFFYAFTN